MEAQAGVTLVHRSPRGSRLTAEGAVVAEWASRLLEVAAQMETGIGALRQDRRARLRISASSTIAEQLLPAWLASFGAARPAGGTVPEITLTAANTEAAITEVADGRADLGFIEGPRQPRPLRSKVIGHDRLAVVVAPGHPWARRRRPLRAAGRLVQIPVPDLDLRRELRAIWDGPTTPPPGLARDLIAHILARHRQHRHGSTPGAAARPRRQPPGNT
jgi:DNA-binding transcriptional LysR family regulator